MKCIVHWRTTTLRLNKRLALASIPLYPNNIFSSLGNQGLYYKSNSTYRSIYFFFFKKKLSVIVLNHKLKRDVFSSLPESRIDTLYIPVHSFNKLKKKIPSLCKLLTPGSMKDDDAVETKSYHLFPSVPEPFKSGGKYVNINRWWFYK